MFLIYLWSFKIYFEYSFKYVHPFLLACLISFLHFDWPCFSDFAFLILSNKVPFFFVSCIYLVVTQNKTLVFLSRHSLALLCLSSENILSEVFFILSHIWIFDPASSKNIESKFWLLQNHYLSPKYLLLSVLWSFWIRVSRHLRSNLDVKTRYWISSHYFLFHHLKLLTLSLKKFRGC